MKQKKFLTANIIFTDINHSTNLLRALPLGRDLLQCLLNK